jgi:putative transposase
MAKRRTTEQIQRLLKEAGRDLAKGLTVADVRRKLGITQTSYFRWRQRFDPAKVDEARQVRNSRTEVERLKLLVADLLLEKTTPQDVAKKSGDRQPAARGRRLAA